MRVNFPVPFSDLARLWPGAEDHLFLDALILEGRFIKHPQPTKQPGGRGRGSLDSTFRKYRHQSLDIPCTISVTPELLETGRFLAPSHITTDHSPDRIISRGSG